MAIPRIVIDNTPTLIFSKGEKYFPCDLFFSGREVVDNKQEYDQKYGSVKSTKKLEDACCYFHVTNGKKYTVLQYWYYYANNYYTADHHEHDFECVKIFINKAGAPKYVNCNIHSFNKVISLKNGVIPEIMVDVGSHAMLPDVKGLKLPFHSWIWHGEKDAKQKTPPKKDMEDLRQEVMLTTYPVMDDEFKIIGDDYDILGRLAAPKMPWARIEYYLPEESLKSITEQQARKSPALTKQPSAEPPKALALGEKNLGPSKRRPVAPKKFQPLRIENQEKTPSLEFFLGSKIYAYVLNKAGINSIEELSCLDVDTIQSRMRTSTQKENLAIAIPSNDEIFRWKGEITRKTL